MTTKRADEAVEAFKRGLSCAQAIFSLYGKDLGFDTETAVKIASAFGAGVAKTGEICGAASGALMVIGLTQRPEDIRDATSREKVYAKARRFLDEFTARNASVNCTESRRVRPLGPEAVRRGEGEEGLCHEVLEACSGRGGDPGAVSVSRQGLPDPDNNRYCLSETQCGDFRNRGWRSGGMKPLGAFRCSIL